MKRFADTCSQMNRVKEVLPDVNHAVAATTTSKGLETELQDKVLAFGGNPCLSQLAVKVASLREFAAKLLENFDTACHLEDMASASVMQDIVHTRDQMGSFECFLRSYLTVAQLSSLLCITFKETNNKGEPKYNNETKINLLGGVKKHLASRSNKGKISVPSKLLSLVQAIDSSFQCPQPATV